MKLLLYNKMSLKRGKDKISGWAAFDLKQRQKQGLASDIKEDSFPLIPGSLTTFRKCQNLAKSNDLSAKPFSSVLLPPVDFLDFEGNKGSVRAVQVVNSSTKHVHDAIEEENYALVLRRLKNLHSWANDSLIEDVLLAADNDFDQASALLREMTSPNSTGGKQTSNEELSTNIDDLSNNKSNQNIPPGNVTQHVGHNTKFVDNKANHKELTDLGASSGSKFSINDAGMNLVLEQLESVPIEPEWEEDDVYLSHRKDAIKMTRSASHHSRAANNAFLIGDHFSAQQYSLKAREEWLAAQRLNSEAAREILSIRNNKNDIWSLDLHGLHATEAVQALQERLRKLESLMSVGRSVSPNRAKSQNGVVRSSSAETLSSMDIENSDNQRTSLRQRSMSLQVITGVGNHSHGKAALPAAVRNFLIENRYQSDEPRPGMVTVRPKYRHS